MKLPPLPKAPAANPTRIVVDACVGENSLLWKAFLGWLGAQTRTFIHLRDSYQGIPDDVILARLLAPGDVLVTMDRPLHSRACALGIASFTLDQSGRMTHKPLRGIQAPTKTTLEHVPELRDTYVHAPSPVTSALRQSMSERELKGYRSRRRRIRAAFGGRDNISQLALTIGEWNKPTGTLGGFQLRIAGRGGQGLEAAEGYAIDVHGALSVSIPPMWALMEIYLLDLEDVPTEAFVIGEDSLKLCSRLKAEAFTPADGSMEHSLQSMLLGFQNLVLHPCRKGPHFDRLTRKLRALGRGDTNEIKAIDFVGLSRGLSQTIAAIERVNTAARDVR